MPGTLKVMQLSPILYTTLVTQIPVFYIVIVPTVVRLQLPSFSFESRLVLSDVKAESKPKGITAVVDRQGSFLSRCGLGSTSLTR